MCKINGKKLEEARLNAGMTQRELAKESGVSQFTISSYENGKSNPSDENVERICMILKISKDDIEIQDIGYNFIDGISKTANRERNKLGKNRYVSSIKMEEWLSQYRDEEKEKTEVANALNNPMSFAHKKYIFIDPAYLHIPKWQRSTDMARAREIAENYDEYKIDPIKACRIDDNNLFLDVIDGAHRVAAKQLRNIQLRKEGKPIEMILVELLDCSEKEAIRIFLGQQSGRKPMITGDMYRGAIESNVAPYIKFKQVFEESRVQITEEYTEIENPLGYVKPSMGMLSLANRKEESLRCVLNLIKDLDWCGSYDKNAYTLRIIKTLMKLTTVYGPEVKEKLLNKCKGAVYYESKVFPVKSNAELYDMLAAEIAK